TDKATMEVESVHEGTLCKSLVPDVTTGGNVTTPIATLLAERVSAAAVSAQPAQRLQHAAAAATPAAPAEAAAPAPAPTATAAAASEAMVQPAVLAGPPMVKMTVREALRDAVDEEMRRDGDVFLMGEEVAEYQGAYKISQGLLDEFGPRRVI